MTAGTPAQTEPIHHGGEPHGVGHRWQDDRQQHSKHESRFARKVLARKHVSGGLPAASAMRTTATLTWNVTSSAWLMPVLFHAWPYHCVVNPSGHHPARQFVAKEVMATEPSTAKTSNPKHPPANQVITLVTVTRQNHRLANGRGLAGRADRDLEVMALSVDVEVMALSVSTRCRAAVDPVTHRD